MGFSIINSLYSSFIFTHTPTHATSNTSTPPMHAYHSKLPNSSSQHVTATPFQMNASQTSLDAI
jgi:hypothetical protein